MKPLRAALHAAALFSLLCGRSAAQLALPASLVSGPAAGGAAGIASAGIRVGSRDSWKDYLAQGPSLPLGDILHVPLANGRVREVFVRVAVRAGVDLERVMAAPTPQAQGLLVREAVGAYARKLLAGAAEVPTLRDLVGLKGELDDLCRVLGAVPEEERGAVRRVGTAVREFLREQSAGKARERIREAVEAWKGKPDGDEAVPGAAAEMRAAARLAPARGTLARLFSGESIRRVFNGDAGDGRWQKDVLDQPWIAKDASVVGLELPAPSSYREYDGVAGSRPDPAQHWRDVSVLTSVADPRYPKDGTVDLAHVAFMDMSGDWRGRLQGYMRLVRPGGFFVMAHNHQYDDTAFAQYNYREKVRDQVTAEFMHTGDWELTGAFVEDNAPPDYPVTRWWRLFQKRAREHGAEMRSRGFQTNNFLLVFRRKR